MGSSSSHGTCVLIVGAVGTNEAAIKSTLRERNQYCMFAPVADLAIEAAGSMVFEIVVVDLDLPRLDCDALLDKVRAGRSVAAIGFCSDSSRRAAAQHDGRFQQIVHEPMSGQAVIAAITRLAADAKPIG